MIDTLSQMWLFHRERRPHAPAFRYESEQRTFGQVVDQGLKLGDSLRRLGIRSQDRVAILAMNRLEWVEIYAACELGGFIALPLNARLSERELVEILRDAAPAVLIYENQYSSFIDRFRAEAASVKAFIALDLTASDGNIVYADLLANGEPREPIQLVPPTAIAHLIYTSGSTGKPKGVARSHAASVVLANANTVIAEFRAEGRELLVMPMFHIGAQGMAMGQHWAGGQVVLHRRFDPLEVVRTVQEQRITALHLAPTLVHQLISLPDIADYDLSSLETICYAAAPMPVNVLRKALKLIGPKFVNIYGSTEIGSATVLPKALHPDPDAPDAERRLKTVGLPTQFVEIRVVAEAGDICAPGEVGELEVRTRQAFSYYWNNSVATIEAMRDGWYATGDMATVTEDGLLALVDRKKDMIISGGENIYSTEVEEVLRSHPDVQDAAVVGVPDERWGEAVMAFVVAARGVDTNSLMDVFDGRIARFKRPREIRVLSVMPTLPSGKADKVSLRAFAAGAP